MFFAASLIHVVGGLTRTDSVSRAKGQGLSRSAAGKAPFFPRDAGIFGSVMDSGLPWMLGLSAFCRSKN